MAQQTAVNFLYEFVQLKLTHKQQMQFEGLFQQAKQMEKEQIIENNKLKAIVEFYEQGCGKERCKAKEPHVH